MARFMALVTIPEFATLPAAEAWAHREFAKTLVRVISTASWEVAEEERPLVMRNRRAREAAADLDPNDGA